MVRVLARVTAGRGFDSRPFHFQVTTLSKSFTHTHTHTPSSTFWYRSRGGDALRLAMRHRLKWSIHLRAHGLDREMSTPPTLS